MCSGGWCHGGDTVGGFVVACGDCGGNTGYVAGSVCVWWWGGVWFFVLVVVVVVLLFVTCVVSSGGPLEET